MNLYTAWALRNIAVVAVVGFAVWVSKDPWAMLGLVFLSSVSSETDEEDEEETHEPKTTPEV